MLASYDPYYSCACWVVFQLKVELSHPQNHQESQAFPWLFLCPESVKSEAFKFLVRLCLEYAWSVWDQKYFPDIKGAERRTGGIFQSWCVWTWNSFNLLNSPNGQTHNSSPNNHVELNGLRQNCYRHTGNQSRETCWDMLITYGITFRNKKKWLLCSTLNLILCAVFLESFRENPYVSRKYEALNKQLFYQYRQ